MFQITIGKEWTYSTGTYGGYIEKIDQIITIDTLEWTLFSYKVCNMEKDARFRVRNCKA